MDNAQSNDAVINGLHEQLKPILEGSTQAVYVYLGDEYKFCNEAFAALLGYGSAEEWAGTDGSFPQLFVAEESQQTLIGSYRTAMTKMAGSANKITWKKKDGGTVATQVILVPLSYQGTLVALHYISA